MKLNTQAQQREVVVQGRNLSPYRLRYKTRIFFVLYNSHPLAKHSRFSRLKIIVYRF
ncbi:MAG: hypothetical protein LBJ00_02715 [Planctomycetaceae bacterium]|nr:hypothetical protein [Planctomycetaceae bacterium]